MLSKLSEEIAECYLVAEDCAQRAKSEPDAQLRTDFLDMERRWLALARGYEFTKQLERFQNRGNAVGRRHSEALTRKLSPPAVTWLQALSRPGQRMASQPKQ